MPGSIGKLAVTLTSRTGPFAKGMKKAGAITTRFAKGIGGMGLKVAKVGGAMGAIAVGGMALYTKRAMDAIDADAKLSRQLGTTIDGLRGLQRASVITGAGQEAMTKGLGFMNKALGEAMTGVGEGKQALEQLGLTAEELAQLPTEQAVGKIADEMNKLTTQSEKAYVASKLFGRGGLALVNTLALGSKGLTEMSDGAVKLQGSMSAIDAKKVEDANDAVADMRTSFTGLFQRVAVAVGPFVKTVANRMTQLFIFIRESIAPLIPMWIDRLKVIAKGVWAFVGNVIKWFKNIPSNLRITALQMQIVWMRLWSRLKTEWITFKGIFTGGWKGAVVLIQDMLGNLAKAFLDTISWIGDKIINLAQWIVDKMPGENKWVQGMIDGYKQGLGAVDAEADKITKKSEKRWEKFWANNKEGGVGMNKELTALNEQMADLEKNLKTQQMSALTEGPAGSGIGAVFSKLAKGISDVKLPNIVDAMKEGGDMAGTAVANKLKKSAGALEKGTVQAFSAELKAGRKADETGKNTVKELKTQTALQRQTNKILAGSQPLVVAIGGGT